MNRTFRIFWAAAIGAVAFGVGGVARGEGTNAVEGEAAGGGVAGTNEVVAVEPDAPAATNAAEGVELVIPGTNGAPAEVAGGTNGVVSVATNVTEGVGFEEEEEKEVKEVPAYRGADMCAAFGGAGSARFGVSGRVNPIARKAGKERPEGAWARNIEVGIDTARGNSDILRYNGAISAFKETEVNTLFAKVSGRYGESEEEKDTESASGEGKAQRRVSERVYVAVDGNVYHDGIADLSYRAQGSLSLGRHLIRTGRTALSAEVGPGYVEEKKGGEQEGFVAGRVAEYLEFLITPSLQIWQSTELVSDVADSSVYFVNAKVGIESGVISDLSLRFTVEDRYDSQPAEDKESNDLLTTTALAWKF